MHKIMILIVLVTMVAITACSQQESWTSRYGDKTSSGEEVVDITPAGTSTASPAKKAEEAVFSKAFKEIPPDDLPKCLEQYDVIKKVLVKAKETVDEFGLTEFKFSKDARVFIDGKPLQEMGGDMSPIPLFETWDSNKVESIEQVESWFAGASLVKITGLRQAENGNWYRVSLIGGSMYEMEGWIHEILLSSTATAKDGSFKGTDPPPSEQGQGRGRRGGRRGRG